MVITTVRRVRPASLSISFTGPNSSGWIWYFSLSSFDLKRTKEELFQNNRQMKNISELNLDIDSLEYSIYESKEGFCDQCERVFFQYHLDSLDIKNTQEI